MVRLLMDRDVKDIIKLYILYLYEYQKHLIMMLMELMEDVIIDNNLHIMLQIFSFH